jgi:hypothetical protein
MHATLVMNRMAFRSLDDVAQPARRPDVGVLEQIAE